jgi:hypothetical protein
MSYTLAQRLAQLPGMGLTDIGPGYSANMYATRSIPSGAPSDYPALCEACLRGRGFIYYKSRPGDCGSPQISATSIKQQIVGTAGAAGSTILAASGVLLGVGLAGATLGIGVAVGAIEEIFQHHQQAIINEQQTLCAVSGVVNQTIAAIDSLVRSGEISPSQGQTYMQSLAQKVVAGLNGILKTCNAACNYIGVMNAHVDFANSYYDTIAPPGSVGAQNPGSAPTAFGSKPGGITSTILSPAAPPPIRAIAIVGDNALVSSAYDINRATGSPQQSSGITGKSGETVPTISISWGVIILFLLGLAALAGAL